MNLMNQGDNRHVIKDLDSRALKAFKVISTPIRSKTDTKMLRIAVSWRRDRNSHAADTTKHDYSEKRAPVPI